MRQHRSALYRTIAARLGATLVVLSIPCLTLLAQQNRIPDRIDQNRRTILKGNVHPKAQPQFDQGPADLALKLERITLMLRPTMDQQTTLEMLLGEQQDPASPNYRSWLTPEDYADRFGFSQADIEKIIFWLQSQALTVEEVARGRNWVAFSATVAQVQAAFRTQIHRYAVDGEMHLANSAEPSVPADLAPAVLGIIGLDDFYPRPPTRSATANRLHPDFTNGFNHSLAPDDLATIYDLRPLYNLGYFGDGQNIVVAGQSDFYVSDITNFRVMFNLPTNVPTKIPVPPIPVFDPQSDNMREADLDVEWTGAIARNANLIYVYSQSAFDAVMYAVNHNLAPIISYSFGGCESGNGIVAAHLDQSIAQQANAQGITWVASAGDAGAAACESKQAATATNGLAVNLPASIPEVTGVGGTEFNEASGNYWSAVNGASWGSALSYIPEKAWNDLGATLAASGGGKSLFFPKPVWQMAPGVPNDGVRDVPDLSLAASADHDAYLYCNNGSCSSVSPFAASLIGGTSASTPVFAGILALLQQYQLAQSFQTTPGLGNINPTLYRLAQNVSNIFHDVTIGDNIVPCVVGTTNCTTGSFGYTSGPGYDLVTGLGSVDASSLIASWHTNQCTYALPAATIVSSHVSAFSLSVTTQSGCPWTAWTSSNWITIIPSTGTGSGNSNFSLAPNNSTQQRTGTVYVAGQGFALTQNPSIAPDLVVTSLVGPNTATIGGQINVTVAVTNQGPVAAGAFKVEFYFSATPNISTSAIDTGWACSFTGLGAGASTQCSGPVGVPSNIAPGNWYLGAIADPTNQVVEQDKSNNSRAADSGTITLTSTSGAPSLAISKTHAGNFAQGQQKATYTVTVSNNNAAATTNGTVTVTETIPSGLTLLSMAGTGWNCASNACMRSDALAAGASYPILTATVNVLSNATSPQVNQVSVSGGGSPLAIANDSTVITASTTGTPSLTVNRTKLNFGYTGAMITSPQTVTVNITGGVNVGWTASSNLLNVNVSPASGTGSGTFQVTATPPSSGGSSNAVITVTAAGATGSPQQIQVSVASVTAAAPFGSFDTPANNLGGVSGAIGITGWALDTVEVTRVSVYREPAPGEGAALAFIGDAVFVADARPDVAGIYASAPYQYRGGWGYQMLTNFLPNASGSGPLGNGTYNLHVLATNANGTVTDLGTRTITVDNIHAAKPFGTIDTPTQGGDATGNAYVNFGWALTQNPFVIPTDGSTIFVYLDGVAVGHPVYNRYRSDIATLFPGHANSNGAVGFFMIDTTLLKNKVHTISWSVTDNGNRTDGIGSRFFTVFNANGGGVAAPEEQPTPESLAGPVQVRSGDDLNAPATVIAPDDTGTYSLDMEQVGRIELSLGATKGYQIVGHEAAELPLGSSLKAGVFYWQPPLGFFGKYDLVFDRPDGMQICVHVNIVPKRYSLQSGQFLEH